ncbi:DUF4190 domain-containing protein [Subtercola endophyticus]
MHQIRRTGQRGRALALAGTILGYAGVFASLLAVNVSLGH